MSTTHSPNRRRRLLLLVVGLLAAFCVLLAVFPSVRHWLRTRDATRSRTPVNTSERELIATSLTMSDLAKHSGIDFGEGAELVYASDPGVGPWLKRVDPRVGSFTWIIRSPSQFSVPLDGQGAASPYTPQTVEVVANLIDEALGGRIATAGATAVGSDWTVDVFKYQCLVLTTPSGHYLHVQRFRTDYPP